MKSTLHWLLAVGLVFAAGAFGSSVSGAESPVVSEVASVESGVDLSGCWSGSWLSCKSGHHGPMTARLVPCGDEWVRAEFQGRFFKVFPFRYTATLRVVERSEDAIQLSGQQYLGRLFGTFSYTATVTESEFTAEYRAKRDYGRFSLRAYP